ncbi:CBS domain-containing protein [Streptomyces sp. NPDC006208]|uniref:CBS domain-containing protein n=1 Tax=Streptomyces sp. NPDC006208 TaxID=3156734 RepID=UPI0033B10A0F
MTLVQMQPRSMSAATVHRTAADAMDTGGPQVCDDMTVEVALSVMASARTGHLLVCDNDGLCTGLLTQAQLTAARDSSAYTDRVQLRDILGDRGPFTSPVTSMAEAEHAMRCRRLDALPVVDERGSALGVLALAR